MQHGTAGPWGTGAKGDHGQGCVLSKRGRPIGWAAPGTSSRIIYNLRHRKWRARARGQPGAPERGKRRWAPGGLPMRWIICRENSRFSQVAGPERGLENNTPAGPGTDHPHVGWKGAPGPMGGGRGQVELVVPSGTWWCIYMDVYKVHECVGVHAL